MLRPEPPSPRTPKLATALDLRRNAFAFLRLALALVVIAGHSWEVGGYGRDPLHSLAGVTLGALAVHCFFVVGGFLVAGSFENSRSVWGYFIKRALRILPGFWACLAVTTLVFVPLGLALSPVASASATDTLAYAARNAAVRILQPGIGTLFVDNPAAGVVNGSLWSLFPELLCYTGLGLFGTLGLLRAGRRRVLLGITLGAAVLFATSPWLLARCAGFYWVTKLWYLLQLAALFAFFIAGACLWVFRTALPFGPSIRRGALAAAVLMLAGGAYPFVGPVLLPFAVLALAVSLPWTACDRFGDFSYGLYLYHYPVQQLFIAAHLRPSSPLLFFVQTVAATLPLAWLSWRWVEFPAIRLKRNNPEKPASA